MTDLPRRVVVVGAGHAGEAAVAQLRQHGFDGEVVLVGEEPVAPYHRPPLSKSLLREELGQPLQPAEFYAERRIELRTGARAVAVDRDAATVRLADGEQLAYDALILATGARPRRPPIAGLELRHVYELRTLHDARRLAAALTPGCRLVVVGGGWIGLEVAASARSAGLEVAVVEREERLLARVASPELSRAVEELHLRQGTDILTSAQVTALQPGDNGAVGSILLEDGRVLSCDAVLVCVGAVADDELAQAAGLRCADGVVVDGSGRTDDARVYAVGDVTRRPVHRHDGLFRLESIPSAMEQARQAAAAICGNDAPEPEVPWFWSDQFHHKLQIAGLLDGADNTATRVAGKDGVALFHTREGRLVAVEALDAPAEFIAGRRMIRDGACPDPAALADPAVPLAELVPVHDTEAAPEAATPGRQALPGPSGKPGEPRVAYIQFDGTVCAADVPVGKSVMEGSVRNNFPGIIGECGGMASCGTCHVHVDEEWVGRLAEPEYEEQDLLEFIDDRRANSRLSCQIAMTDDLDGLVVRVPQYEG